MMSNGETFQQALESAPLNRRFWTSIALLVLITVVDYFDFFIVGFLVSVVAPEWKLSYAQTAVVLLSAGVGSIVGAVLMGALADRWGRKPMLILSVALCAVGSGSVAFLPFGAWIEFAVLRFLVGVGLGGASTAAVTLAVELTPARVRTSLVSAMGIPVSIAVLLAAGLSSFLLPLIGWRGLAAIGFAPLVLAVVAFFMLPESARWLASRGREAAARAVAARQLGRSLEHVEMPQLTARGASRVFDLLTYPRQFWLVVLAWFGFSTTVYAVMLWGPTIVSQLLRATPAEAARMFIYVSLAGILGRVVFSIAPSYLGRVPCGQIIGFGTAVTLLAAAIWHDGFAGALPLFLIFLVVGAIFYDGGAVNLGPMATEVYPVRLAARASGLGQAANGIGKIAGPLVLAMIAGADNPVTPEATSDAVTPAFIFLAGCGLLVGLSFTFLGVESHGRRLAFE